VCVCVCVCVYALLVSLSLSLSRNLSLSPVMRPTRRVCVHVRARAHEPSHRVHVVDVAASNTVHQWRVACIVGLWC
jgi:hypothetical protein